MSAKEENDFTEEIKNAGKIIVRAVIVALNNKKVLVEMMELKIRSKLCEDNKTFAEML